MKIWEKIKKQNLKKLAFGIVIGGLAGYAYYYFIGCSSGTCPITSSPLNSILYGSFTGIVISIK